MSILFKHKVNWQYAIGEVILIFIGITLAIGFNNWNEERNDRKKEKEVLNNIKINLDRNEKLFNNLINMLDSSDKSYKVILHLIESDLPYSDSLIVHFFQSSLTRSHRLQINSDGYKSFENAGFDIIRDHRIKDVVISLYEVIYDRLSAMSALSRSKYSNLPYNYYDFFYMLSDNVKSHPVPIDFERLKSNKKYETFLNSMKNSRDLIRGALEESLSETQRVLQLIKNELGEK